MTIPLLKISSFRASACATAGSESLENPNNRARPLGVYDLEVSHTKAARCRTGMSRAATSPARGVTSGSKCKSAQHRRSSSSVIVRRGPELNRPSGGKNKRLPAWSFWHRLLQFCRRHRYFTGRCGWSPWTRIEDRIFFNDTLWNGFQSWGFQGAASRTNDAERSAQLERRMRDDQEEYWRAYQILNHIVEQAGPTPLGKKAAERAVFCL